MAITREWLGRGGWLPDLSAATEARATLLRRQPPSLRRWPAYDDEIGELERALLRGHVSQKVFDGRCRKIADRPLPSWMTKAGEPEMTLERRVQELEARQPDENWECHRIIVEVGQS